MIHLYDIMETPRLYIKKYNTNFFKLTKTDGTHTCYKYGYGDVVS